MKRTVFLFFLLLGCMASCMMDEYASIPALNSVMVIESTETSITVECNVVIDADFPVTERGLKWGMSDMTREYTRLFEDNQTGTFRLTIDGLSPSTTYYFRLYENNISGIRYSNLDSIKTGPGRPVPALAPSDIIYYSNKAQITAAIVRFGDAPLKRIGFCWNKTGNPTIADEMILVAFEGDGDLVDKKPQPQPVMFFSAEILPLEADQLYYISAFAENEIGIAYSFPVSLYTNMETDRPTLFTLDPVIKDDAVIFGGTLINVGSSDVVTIGIEVSGNRTAEYNKTVTLSTTISATNVPYSFQTEPIPITEFGGETNDYYSIRAFARNFRYDIGYGNVKILYPPSVSKE
jgi:hypothetical protein